MAKKKQLIVPIFIPQYGCPHQCVFCNQQRITGSAKLPEANEAADTIDAYLRTWKGSGRKEVAFYGGSFTGLDMDTQERFLKAAFRFVEEGLICSIRISTRPDYITVEGLALLKRYGVETVELGVQSMSDEVLRLSGRGHTAEDTSGAVTRLKKDGFRVGLQLMPGLPGDSAETILYTAVRAVELRPDFVRIYPTVVVKDTPLEKMYLNALYRPWPLNEMVKMCREMVSLFNAENIPIIRLGLQHTETLEQDIVAGPYHPSFRELVKGRQALKEELCYEKTFYHNAV